MEVFSVWIILSVFVGYYAETKGKSGILYFFISLIISPLLGLVIALIAKPDESFVIKKDGMKKCPQCKELIKKDAVICRFCHKSKNISFEDKPNNFHDVETKDTNIDKLIELSRLLEKGLISKEEFDDYKKSLTIY